MSGTAGTTKAAEPFWWLAGKNLGQQAFRTGYVTAKRATAACFTQEVYDACTQYGGFIAGGFARYLLATPNQPPRPFDDIDVFFPNDMAFTATYVWFDKYWLLDKDGKSPWSCKFRRAGRSPVVVNLVTPIATDNMVIGRSWYDTIRHFDFTVCSAALLSYTEGTFHPAFLEDEDHGRLRPLHIYCPFRFIRRVERYAKKGYKMWQEDMRVLFDEYTQRKFSAMSHSAGGNRFGREANIGYGLFKGLNVNDVLIH